jgi:methylase of polypeptide subunit release factors
MNKSLLTSEPVVQAPSPNQVFFCPEESQFYAHCLEKMVLSQSTTENSIVEFGAGDGNPVIQALLKSAFRGTIHGYESNPEACQLAQVRIQQYRLDSHYRIHNACFFEQSPQSAQCLIANPPYLPAPDNQLYMPSLHGGDDGATITKRLLANGCEQVMLMISAYSNPVDTIDHARKLGYQVVDFMVSPLKFGYYTSEPKVRQTITALRHKQKAFFSENIYFLAGVLFQRHSSLNACLSEEFLKVMTVL